MATLQKGLIQRQDVDNFDGTLATSRTNSTGGTTSGLKVGDAVDVLSVYGDGDTGNLTRATILAATTAQGSANIALAFAPGTWTIDDDLTIAANFTCIVPAGCVFSVASGKTLTIAGVLFRQHSTYTAGAGTVTVSGTDLLAASGSNLDFDDDTGSADAYVITPASSPSAYSEGQVFRFKAANANTGASTINVNSLGVKNIVKPDGSTALAANDIVNGHIYTIIYEDTGGHFHLMDGGIEALQSGTVTWAETQTLSGAPVELAEGASVASATTADIWTNDDGNSLHITGTTTITSLGTAPQAGAWRLVIFDGALTLTDGASLILPGNANITTAADDCCLVYADTTTVMRVVGYWKANGEPVSTPALSGHVLQIVNSQTGASATGTTVMPDDDTIPQNTEGDEYLTLAITPSNSNNKLMIEVSMMIACSSTNRVTVALFQDSTAGALAATSFKADSGNIQNPISFRHYMTAGTASETTFKVRAGPHTSSTVNVNGVSGARILGGVAATSITITETKA